MKQSQYHAILMFFNLVLAGQFKGEPVGWIFLIITMGFLIMSIIDMRNETKED